MNESPTPPPLPDAAVALASKRGPIGRAVKRFVEDPSSSRYAIVLIVLAQLLIVFVAGVAIWLLDRREFEQLTDAFWYILQTVTTVGYGDVTPADTIGRLIGSAVMLLGIASLSILTALITSSFIEARQAARVARRETTDVARWEHLEARLQELVDTLDRIENAERQTSPPPQ